MLNLTRTKILDDVLIAAEMPPGVGIGRQANGHGEDGDEENGDEEAGDGEGEWGESGGAKCHVNLHREVNVTSLSYSSILARRRERAKY